MASKLRNISTGPRGAWQGLTLVMAEPGEVIEAEDFEPEWFEVVSGEAAADKPAPAVPAPSDPLDHDGDGRRGGSPAGENATRRRGRRPAE